MSNTIWEDTFIARLQQDIAFDKASWGWMRKEMVL